MSKKYQCDNCKNFLEKDNIGTVMSLPIYVDDLEILIQCKARFFKNSNPKNKLFGFKSINELDDYHICYPCLKKILLEELKK